jgi:hypothetical protein
MSSIQNTVSMVWIDIHERLENVHTKCRTKNQCSGWLWTPQPKPAEGHSVDWIASSANQSTIVRGPEYVAHFTQGARISSTAGRDLIATRKAYKKLA